jgi:predicted N-formylglutamate amidohydrolase
MASYAVLNVLSKTKNRERRDAHYRPFHEWLTKKHAEYGMTGAWLR